MTTRARGALPVAPRAIFVEEAMMFQLPDGVHWGTGDGYTWVGVAMPMPSPDTWCVWQLLNGDSVTLDTPWWCSS